MHREHELREMEAVRLLRHRAIWADGHRRRAGSRARGAARTRPHRPPRRPRGVVVPPVGAMAEKGASDAADAWPAALRAEVELALVRYAQDEAERAAAAEAEAAAAAAVARSTAARAARRARGGDGGAGGGEARPSACVGTQTDRPSHLGLQRHERRHRLQIGAAGASHPGHKITDKELVTALQAASAGGRRARGRRSS